MANRLKEDEKNERIIRGLLKLPENRRCINCNSLGPQYVCTNFWTFICTNCSGIHREFTHRVKSVSMSKFTSQEVTALQEGGNQRAKEIYFKEMDPQHHSFPDSSNGERLRDFLKHAYVDRRYSGERNFDKPPRVKTGENEDSYRGGQSPPYEDTYDRRYSEKSSPGGRIFDERRSPGSDDHRSPARPDIVNDWRREDRFGNGKRADDRRISDGDPKSPDRPTDLDSLSPPMVRPVREILGDSVSPLRIIEPPKSNVSRAADRLIQTQRTASSSSLGSVSGNAMEPKLETVGSLIDFDASFEPVTPAVPQPQQNTAPQSVSQPVNAANDNNWASFDVSLESKLPRASSNVNSLESVLSQLSVSASVPGSNAQTSFFDAGAPARNLSTFLSSGASIPALPVNGPNSYVRAPGTGQWPNMQQQQPLFPNVSVQSMAGPFPQPVAGNSNNQPWNLTHAGNLQWPPSNPAALASKAAASSVVPQPSVVEANLTGRKELPADLFAATYSPYPAPAQGWQRGPPNAMGFVIPYNTAVQPNQNFQHSSRSVNPFDVGGEAPQVQNPAFPSMTPLQGAVPSGQSPGLMHSASFGTPSAAWLPSQHLPYTSSMPPQPSYQSTMPPRGYMIQQIPGNMQPSRPQGVAGNFGNDGAPAYGSLNTTPSPYSSVGGNPFG